MDETDQPVTSHPGGVPTTPKSAESEISERKETEFERYDRNLTELMGELRVALPGVQVLFGFLLVIPFDSRFEKAGGALTCAISFVTDFVFGSTAAIICGLLAATFFGLLWYVLPLARIRRGG